MSSAQTHGVVCYVAREHGLAGVAALLASTAYRPVALLTHRRLPLAEDALRSERGDFAQYQALALAHQIPLFSVDCGAEADQVTDQLDQLEFDLIASISWRRLITPRQLAQPRIGGVNLHRGKLPQYAGASPVHRALQDGQAEIEINAHVLTAEVDAGEVLATVGHPAQRRASVSLDDEAERLKREITPLFGPLLIRALDELVKRHGSH